MSCHLIYGSTITKYIGICRVKNICQFDQSLPQTDIIGFVNDLLCSLKIDIVEATYVHNIDCESL